MAMSWSLNSTSRPKKCVGRAQKMCEEHAKLEFLGRNDIGDGGCERKMRVIFTQNA